MYFFTSTEGYVMYMGEDKYENEDLIKYGLPEDFWFHVDDLSSAHVYLRLKPEQRLEDVSAETIMECAQLVKSNSIEGCKMKEVYVVYTRWRNLNKMNSMDVGSIGYHDKSKVKRMLVVKDQSIINKLNKTKKEEFPDLCALQLARAEEYKEKQKQILIETKKAKHISDKKEKYEKECQAKIKNYSGIMKESNMKSNDQMGASIDDSASIAFEDDFF
jgi:hypothetical protein